MSKLDDQLAELQKRVDTLKASAHQAQQETEQQVEKRVAEAKADLQAAHNEASAAEHKAEDDLSASWSKLKHDVKARVAAIHTQVQSAEKKVDAKLADDDANWAEDNALDAIAFARWAIENAAVSVLTAIDRRAYANGQKAGAAR